MSYDYAEQQNLSGLKKGDQVLVIRSAEDYENGWNNSWNPIMDNAIGTISTILSFQADFGIELACDGYLYPYFILQKTNKSIWDD